MSNLDYFIGHSHCEDPLAIQLGGSNPETVGEAAYVAEAWGNYCEINLNVGCPSPRVSRKCFGARLMLDPERVRQITHEMIRKVSRTEVTVKCRIGADDRDSYGDLCQFIEAVRSAGVRRFVLHARKCILDGLSASQNRSVPPLKYEVVHRLKRDFPELSIAINGGIDTFDAVRNNVCACSSPDANAVMSFNRPERILSGGKIWMARSCRRLME
jgi:tRNA-dihydrouridine synthase A